MSDAGPSVRRNAEDYCYRHPDRLSFVLCQRCLRTICPECQTQAPVGVICPECLAEQRRATPPRVARAARRQRVASGRPVVTLSIIVVTAVFFLLRNLVPGLQSSLLFAGIYLYPSLNGVGIFEPWRLVTVLLLHSGWLHFGLNMLALWMLGRILEPMLGRGRFLATYLIAGIGGSVAMTLLAFGTPVVGASGAVFGLLGTLLVIGRSIGADVRGILVVLAINLAIGFLPGFQVAWQAHLGGALVGALLGFVYSRTRRPEQRRTQVLLMAAVFAGLVGLLLVPLAIYG